MLGTRYVATMSNLAQCLEQATMSSPVQLRVRGTEEQTRKRYNLRTSRSCAARAPVGTNKQGDEINIVKYTNLKVTKTVRDIVGKVS